MSSHDPREPNSPDPTPAAAAAIRSSDTNQPVVGLAAPAETYNEVMSSELSSRVDSNEGNAANIAGGESLPLAPAPERASPDDRVQSEDGVPAEQRPRFVFFGIVAATSLILDVLSKAWAEIELSKRTLGDPIVLIEEHLTFTLAYNRGGAWGLLQDASEAVRKPFFFGVSIAAILFIVSLYTKLHPEQKALKWGLPLVLGGALGNLADRVIRGSVVDFIDYRANWVLGMNKLISKLASGWNITDHWPTFNVADVSICIGVGLMAVDMMISRRGADPAMSDAGIASHGRG